MADTAKRSTKRTTRTRKTTATRKKSTPTQPELTPEQRQAKLEAYHALKTAGLDIPQDLATEVESWIAEVQKENEAVAHEQHEEQAKRQAAMKKVNDAGPWYVRNGVNAPFNLRLDRQTESRRIQLKARGTPGDLHPLRDEDLKDPILKQNVNLGVIEIIPAGEAAQVMDKQTTNMGHREHTPLSILRNELGQRYEQGNVRVESEFNRQGVTVAVEDPRLMQGQMSDTEIKRSGLQRVSPGQQPPQQPQQPQASGTGEPAHSVVYSGFVPTDGHPAAIQYGPNEAAQAKIADDLARRKDVQGTQAGLGDLKVVVDPVQKT